MTRPSDRSGEGWTGTGWISARHVQHIVASGEVETEDRSGVFGPHQGYVPLWLYLRDTPLTKPGKLIRELSEESEYFHSPNDANAGRA